MNRDKLYEEIWDIMISEGYINPSSNPIVSFTNMEMIERITDILLSKMPHLIDITWGRASKGASVPCYEIVNELIEQAINEN